MINTLLKQNNYRESGKVLINYLAQNPRFRGIGKARATKLWNKFGENIYQILDKQDVDALATCLPTDLSYHLSKDWAIDIGENESIEFLQKIGFTPTIAKKAIKAWSGETKRILKDNPYVMLAFASWKKVDSIALSIGVVPDNLERRSAAVEATLYEHYDQQNTGVFTDTLKIGVAKKLKYQNIDDIRIKQAFVTLLNRRSMIWSADKNQKNIYQPLGAYAMEYAIEQRILSLTNKSENFQQGSFFIVTSNIDYLDEFQTKNNIHFTVEQKLAVQNVLSNHISLISGGAGVGKTTVLRAILDSIKSQNGTFIQMALSGRAARRMMETSGEPAITIARYLFQLEQKEKNEVHFIIIDESSMLDVPLMYRIFRNTPVGVRFVLVGDHYQLPPIGPGLVFHQLVCNSRIPQVQLTKILRQDESTGIPHVSQKIRNGVWPDIPTYRGQTNGVSILQCKDEEIVNNIIDLYQQLRKHTDDTQILGMVKSRKAGGTKTINSALHELYCGDNQHIFQSFFAQDDLVMFGDNDYIRGIYNGTLGKIVEVFETPVRTYREVVKGKKVPARILGRGIFDLAGLQEIYESDLEKMDYGYAITIHKAQGSQFQKVIIPVVDNRLLDRTMIYTGITRAVDQVILVGNIEIARKAVQKTPRAFNRVVGFHIDD